MNTDSRVSVTYENDTRLQTLPYSEKGTGNKKLYYASSD
jgi:hypothetical protein